MRYWEPPEGGIGGPDAWTGGEGHAPAQRSDPELTEAVKAALALQPGIDERYFTVHTINGVVHLFGIAASPAERDLALEAARTVAGVQDVEDDIQINPER